MDQVLKKTSKTRFSIWKNSVSETIDLMDNHMTQTFSWELLYYRNS